MDYTVTFQPDNVRANIGSGKSILDAARSAGILLYSVCDGEGSCGRCKIFVREGKVSVEALPDGSYLACKTYPTSDLIIEIPQESRLGAHQRIEEFIELSAGKVTGSDVGIAVDVGTTTVSVCMIDYATKKPISQTSEYNRQVSYGADVLSRITYAERSGVETLNRLIIDTINNLISVLTKDQPSLRVKEIVAAGNTTMIYILMDRDPSVVRDDPEALEFRQPLKEAAEKLRLHCSGGLYALPAIGGYVGGDVVADILASGLHLAQKPSMLIDVGTNGEIVLGCRDWLLACSTSAGPAFEGGEVACGMNAVAGAIEDVSIKDDEITYSTIRNEKPLGFCGSGLISLVSELFLSGIVDYRGKFTDTAGNRIRNGASDLEFLVASAEETLHNKDIFLSEKDIRSIILSKAAIYAGARTLSNAGVAFSELDRIYIAGDFGYHLNIEKAVSIGLLPDVSRDKFTFIGNGSLKGASIVLSDPSKRKEAEDIAKLATYRDLSKASGFPEEYLAALYLPHKDETLFPSIEPR
jgi:uncharacterized 2Fe-2S/4Fe-4S cluster protein (DUF4445 family)